MQPDGLAGAPDRVRRRGVDTAPVPGAGRWEHGDAASRGEIPDYEIGCLQTDKPGFYDRLGWELWRGPLAGRGTDGLVPTPDQRGVMVLPLLSTPPLDLDTSLTVEVQADRIWE